MAKTKAFVTSNAQAQNAARDRLNRIAEDFSQGQAARDRDYAEIAKAAADMIGTDLPSRINSANELYRLGRMADTWGNASTGFGDKAILDNALTGYNKPLGMGAEQWGEFGDMVRSMNEQGFSNAQIAAFMRFDDALYELWR